MFPLGKFRSDAYFAFFVLASFVFKTICIHFDRLVVYIGIKHRYSFFAYDFSAFDLAPVSFPNCIYHFDFGTYMAFLDTIWQNMYILQ